MFAFGRDTRSYSHQFREIEHLLRQLEARASKLTGIGVNEAASGASQLMDAAAGRVSDLAESFRRRYGNGSSRMVGGVAGDAARFGQDAWRRVASEAEHHPLITLAVAVGIGYLAGMAGRRS
jgi:hypothetical protein